MIICLQHKKWICSQANACPFNSFLFALVLLENSWLEWSIVNNVIYFLQGRYINLEFFKSRLHQIFWPSTLVIIIVNKMGCFVLSCFESMFRLNENYSIHSHLNCTWKNIWIKVVTNDAKKWKSEKESLKFSLISIQKN